jgi:hypothetical protein
MHSIRRHLVWLVVAVIGAFALGTVALARGEAISALWVVIAAICTYLIAYRYYSLFIADRVLRLDGNRKTPAHRHNDGLDYVPTDKNVLFGHHFAAIAGGRPAGRAGAGGADGLPAGAAVDPCRRGVRRRGAGLHRALHLDAARRPLARRPDQAGDGHGAGPDRLVRHLHDHDHHPRGAGADRGQGAGRVALGHLHGGGHDSGRGVHGRVPALHPAGAHRRDLGDRLRAPDAGDLRRPGGGAEPDLGRRCSPSTARR